MGKAASFRGSARIVEPLESRWLLAGNGLSAQYFDNSNLTGESVKRIDATVNFEWGTGSPAAGIGADTFSARWTGQVSPETSGQYTFFTKTDDGVRLWVNGVLLVDKWVNQGGTEWSGSINLQAGVKYSLKMEYFENTGGALARLSWSGPGITKRVIPTGRLFNDAVVTPPTTTLAAPTGLDARYTGGLRVEVTWNDVAGEAGYKVERKLDGTNDWKQIGTTGENVTKYVDETVEPGHVYIYRVRAFKGEINSPYSNTDGSTIPAEATTKPAAPTDLRVTEVGSNFVRLAWNDVANETAYRIERRLDGTDTWTPIGTTGQNVTTYKDEKELVAGKTYIYRVFAINAAGSSLPSNTVAAKIPEGVVKPAAPRDLHVVEIGANFVRLAWIDVAGETGYRIERRLDGTDTWNPVGTTAENVTTFKDEKELVAGKTYIYRVIAVNSAGDSDPSNTAAAKIPGGDTKPAAPTNLHVVEIGSNFVRLEWNDVPGETAYRVERRLDGTETWNPIGTTAANVTTYKDEKELVAGKTYIYRVIAVNGAGNSEPSNAVAAKIPGGDTKPAAPTNLHVVEFGASFVRLEWNDVAGETAYRVERRLDGTTTWNPIGTTAANVTTYKDEKELVTGKTYIYRVIAVNAAGNSEPSNTASAKIPDGSVRPAAPTDLRVTAVTATTVSLAWNNVAGETGYEIQRRLDGTPITSFAKIGNAAANATTYIDDDGLESGKTYIYRVIALNGGLRSEPSNTAAAKMPGDATIVV